MLIRVFCVVSMLNKLPGSRGVLEGGGGGATGLLNKRRGSNRLPGVVTEQQAVEFPQVQTSPYDYESLLIYVVRRQGTPDLFGWSIHGSFAGAIFFSFYY